MSVLRPLIERLLDGAHLREDEAEAALAALLSPDEASERKAAFLVALRAKGETPEEITGLARRMRAMAKKPAIPAGLEVVDTCGTGGDASHSINVSTAAALVVAGAGIPVAKHGNRSVSSRSGSADVLEALGIRLPEDGDAAAAMLAETGFAFLFAPSFHGAMKEIAPVRRALGLRTVFNLLGPLTNPATPPFQVVGAFSVEAARKMAGALARLGVQRAFVVHGEPGWDEATPMGRFFRADVRDGAVTEAWFDPRETYGIPRCEPEDLAGGDAAENAAHLAAILNGRRGPHRDAVLLNAALVFEVTGRTSDPREAVAMAAAAIDGGGARALLDRLVARG